MHFFQSKVLPPTLWNYLDRVLSFNLVIAHIPGKANYGGDFLCRIQTEKNACLKIIMKDKIPIKRWTKYPLRVWTNAELVEQLQKIGRYDEYIQKNQLENQISKLYSLTIPKINAISFPNPDDMLENILTKQHPIRLKEEQHKDEDIRQFIQEKRLAPTNMRRYASKNLKRYFKHLNRLAIEDEVLYQLFYNYAGKIEFKQYCLPKHLWKETLCRIQFRNSRAHWNY